jgi:hypothetical protein
MDTGITLEPEERQAMMERIKSKVKSDGLEWIELFHVQHVKKK